MQRGGGAIVDTAGGEPRNLPDADGRDLNGEPVDAQRHQPNDQGEQTAEPSSFELEGP